MMRACQLRACRDRSESRSRLPQLYLCWLTQVYSRFDIARPYAWQRWWRSAAIMGADLRERCEVNKKARDNWQSGTPFSNRSNGSKATIKGCRSGTLRKADIGSPRAASACCPTTLRSRSDGFIKPEM